MSKCILVVEDQEDNRQTLRDCSAVPAMSLTKGENGEEAIAAGPTSF
jgi:CheY-like chemotaxis protein